MCKCGLGHRGWEENKCRIELFKREKASKTPVTTAPTPKIKTVLGDPSDPVSSKKAEKKPVTRDEAKTERVTVKKQKTVTRDNSASRMAELRKRKAATGLIEIRGIWTHPDDMAAIKKFAKELDANRSKVS